MPAPSPPPPPPPPLILIAEDETALVELLAYNLKREGFAIRRAADGRQALLQAAKTPAPDLLLLDWMLPGPSGIDICKRLRRDPLLKPMPIIILTARGEELDRVSGLNAGADDYITKPFSMKELIARIKALLRRAHAELDADIILRGGLKINKTAHSVSCVSCASRASSDAQKIALSSTEFKLLVHLANRPGHIFSRENLLDAVWGSESELQARTVDANIKRLRQQIKKNCGHDPIRTVRGLGYVFDN